MKKTVLTTLTILCLLSIGLAQMHLTTLGQSPREADVEATDIFDRAYNSLPNVGVETKMYFKGHLEGMALVSPTWTITGPTGSTATISAPAVIDTSTEIVAFIPDSTGTYTITFTSDTNTASLVFNAGTYVGVNAGTVTCQQCHNGHFNDWSGTGHADMFERGVNGIVSSHYASYCIGCHTVGYDALANNNGFDDRTQFVPIYGVDTTFVYPDSATLVDFYGSPDGHLYEGVYDSMLVFFPSSMELANIQCESCHGPGSRHSGNTADARMVASLNAEVCAWCHDSGTHHAFPDQWKYSQHAILAYGGYAGGRTACAQCHSGSGFIKWVDGGQQPLTQAPPVAPITCATCHDPHSAANNHQLRLTAPVQLGNGVMVDGGNGSLCMNCHKSRRNAAEYTAEVSYSSHFGPHHGPQTDMLAGANVPSFGVNLPSSPHLAATGNACVDCHMAGEHLADDQGNIIHAGGHTFSMTDPDGNDHVEACEGCHGDIGESFAEKKYFLNGNADHDGDGVEEGVQEEIHGLLEELALMLPPVDVNEVDISGTYIYTLTEVKAAYNWFFVEEDRSGGIHNPAFAVALLKVSIQAVLNNAIEGEIVAIDDVPNDQGKQVKIIWDKFVDDGVAVDPVQTYIVKRFDGHDSTWTGVGEHTADGSPRYALVVPTLFDSTAAGSGLTEFKVVAVAQSGFTHHSLPAAGYSVDNLVPHAPGNLVASVTGADVTLNWEAPDDPDINYYRVFRATQPNFSDMVEIGTTTDIVLNDFGLANGTYYYKLQAIDFSGNLGEFSSAVEVEIELGIGDEVVPVTYSLAQNYPNPFNPVTTIDFALPERGFVNLTVYNAKGQIVKNLVNREMEVGRHSVTLNASDLASGMYFYVIKAGNFTQTKKMVLLK